MGDLKVLTYTVLYVSCMSVLCLCTCMFALILAHMVTRVWVVELGKIHFSLEESFLYIHVPACHSPLLTPTCPKQDCVLQ